MATTLILFDGRILVRMQALRLRFCNRVGVTFSRLFSVRPVLRTSNSRELVAFSSVTVIGDRLNAIRTRWLCC